PEGRKYNRRVTIGVIDPGTGVVIRHETETPGNLVNPATSKYYIVLEESSRKLGQGYFSNLDITGKLVIRSKEEGAVTRYIIGVFYSREDAAKYLNYVRTKGFGKAYITETE
ncbi:MAG TPA: hypothetical protein PLZ75_08305, partial [Bacteroidales bacterium]|nr:hypothetical protein [Bacteroidales bacterium]